MGLNGAARNCVSAGGAKRYNVAAIGAQMHFFVFREVLFRRRKSGKNGASHAVDIFIFRVFAASVCGE